ncbi:MAG TPA: DoxX family protein [Thermoanaerobaculia bacterium]|nr:DoxX family protein [Thermoanaerobaculia bacterium]
MSSLCVDRYDHLPSATAPRIVRALLATDNNALLTTLRLTLGVVMLPHGLQKTVGWFGGYGFEGTMNGFAGLGIPAVLAFLAIFAESAGAIALITGITTRIAAFGVGVTLTVAATMHKANGFFMNWSGQQKGEGVEFHILAVAIAVVLMIGGAGRFSIDRAITK